MSAPARTLPGDKGTADRIEADGGQFWVRLVTRQALDREGAWMDHCVGDGAYDGLAGSEYLTDDAIWSLRDADGTPRLTVEVTRNRVVSAKGYRNHKPGRGAALQVRHLVAAFAADGAKLAVMPMSDIVLAPDGRTFRTDRVPADVQAALDAAERERQADRERRDALAPHEYVIPYGQIVIRSNEDPRRPILGDVSPFRMVTMSEALRQASEPRTGVTAYPQVLSGMHYRIVADGGRQYGIEVAAVTARGGDLVSGDDYIVDQGLGLVGFTRDLDAVEVLWREAPTDAFEVRLDGERARVRARRAGLFETLRVGTITIGIDTQNAP